MLTLLLKYRLSMDGRSKVYTRVKSLHAALVAAGHGGRIVPARDVVRLVCEQFGLSTQGARYYMETGEAVGLWERVGGKSALKRNLPTLPNQEEGLRILTNGPAPTTLGQVSDAEASRSEIA